jgi:HEAT repeat protein
MSAQLMGNICSLVQNPKDLLPYMEILRPAIKNSLFDSIPEIRAAAAKALGSLCSGLGAKDSSDLHAWLINYLHSEELTAAERSGAS